MGDRLEWAMCEKANDRRVRRLKAMLGEDRIEMPDDRIARMPDAVKADDSVRAVLTHPDGRVEILRMSRRGETK